MLVVTPGAAVGWSGWCPQWYLSPHLQGWVHRVTSGLALLPPSWLGWAMGGSSGMYEPGGKMEGMESAPSLGTSLMW